MHLRPSSSPFLHACAAAALATLLGTPATALAAAGVFDPIPLKPKDAELIEKSGEMRELFARRGYVLPDGPETQLVERVGRAVAPPHPTDAYENFRFGILNDPVPNAFALPDGQVWVHAGLLAVLENEAQLAAVLAHECMHVEGHHSILNARQARAKQGGMVALSVLLGDIGNLINIAFQHAIIGYGRDLEEEADRHAVQRVLDAGYDPREMPRVFELLEQDPEGDQPPQSPTWSDHPLNVERKRYTNEILGQLAPSIASVEKDRGPLTVGTDGFLETVVRSTRDAVRQYIAADRPRTALVLADRLVTRWPDDPSAHALAGDALRALGSRTPVPAEPELTKKAKRAMQRDEVRHTRYEREQARLRRAGASSTLEQNRSLAKAAYEDALRLDPLNTAALAGLGHLAQDRGDLLEAGRQYAAWLKAAPKDAADRPVILKRLREVNADLAGRKTAAAKPASPASSTAPVQPAAEVRP